MKLLCTCTSAFAYVSIPSCPVVFCEALVSEYLSLVCISLRFAVSFHGPVPVHALS